MSEPHDELARLLSPPPDAGADRVRREQTLAATIRILHRKRCVQPFVLAAGGVALFAAGGVTGWVAKPIPPSQGLVVPPPPTQLPSPRPVEVEPLPAERLELNAELADDPSDAARLFREAGDRFLTARDYENAARCYRRHLSVADADTLKVSGSDSWMLHSMKTPDR